MVPTYLWRVEYGYVFLIMNNCIIEAVVLSLQSKEILSKIDFSDITYQMNRVLKIRPKVQSWFLNYLSR